MRCRLMLAVRLLWECRGGIRDGSGRNDAKPCSACVCGTSPDCRKRYKIAFDHRQKNLYFYRSPWVSWQKSESPGIAKLVSRLVWDQETVRSSRTTRTKSPLKSLISEGFSYSLSIAMQEVNLLFLTYFLDKRRLNIVIFTEVQYN